MEKLLTPTKEQTASFFAEIGFPIKAEDIVKVYPGVFSDRRVVRVCGDGDIVLKALPAGDIVLKARPSDTSGLAEITKARILFDSYRISGGKFPGIESVTLPSKYLVIKMSYIGPSLPELAQEMGERDYDPGATVSFRGLSAEEVHGLIEHLRTDHLQFAEQHGLIHGDVKQEGYPPSNVLLNFDINRLMLIDGEALVRAETVRIEKFHEQLVALEGWMRGSLVL